MSEVIENINADFHSELSGTDVRAVTPDLVEFFDSYDYAHCVQDIAWKCGKAFKAKKVACFDATDKYISNHLRISPRKFKNIRQQLIKRKYIHTCVTRDPNKGYKKTWFWITSKLVDDFTNFVNSKAQASTGYSSHIPKEVFDDAGVSYEEYKKQSQVIEFNEKDRSVPSLDQIAPKQVLVNKGLATIQDTQVIDSNQKDRFVPSLEQICPFPKEAFTAVKPPLSTKYLYSSSCSSKVGRTGEKENPDYLPDSPPVSPAASAAASPLDCGLETELTTDNDIDFESDVEKAEQDLALTAPEEQKERALVNDPDMSVTEFAERNKEALTLKLETRGYSVEQRIDLLYRYQRLNGRKKCSEQQFSAYFDRFLSMEKVKPALIGQCGTEAAAPKSDFIKTHTDTSWADGLGGKATDAILMQYIDQANQQVRTIEG